MSARKWLTSGQLNDHIKRYRRIVDHQLMQGRVMGVDRILMQCGYIGWCGGECISGVVSIGWCGG